MLAARCVALTLQEAEKKTRKDRNREKRRREAEEALEEQVGPCLCGLWLHGLSFDRCLFAGSRGGVSRRRAPEEQVGPELQRLLVCAPSHGAGHCVASVLLAMLLERRCLRRGWVEPWGCVGAAAWACWLAALRPPPLINPRRLPAGPSHWHI